MIWPVLLMAFGLYAAEPLAVIDAVLAQSDGGTPVPSDFEHTPGEVMFFSCRVAGYQVTAEKVQLKYRIDAFDAQGVRLVEPIEAPIAAEISPQDKDWRPKIRQEIAIPPLAASGKYRVSISLQDLLAKTSTTKDIHFLVHGHEVAPSDTLTVRNFHFYRSEDEPQPLAKAAYRPGDAVWARFDIIGYKLAEGNRIDVSYGIAVLNAEGKVLWSQAEAAAERSQSFYPKRYVPGSMSINLQPKIKPGSYGIAVTAKDAVGNQSYETKQTFTVE
jgi:hypothetical protein